MALRDRVKPWVAELQPYQPGKPVEELERELGISDAIKLASNENALGPSPKAIEAIRAAASEVHRYPDGVAHDLRERLAARWELAPQHFVFGSGADELLELVAKAFLGPGDECVFAWPSFAMYPIVVKGMGATPVPVPLDGDLVHDLEALAAAVTGRTRVLFVCNPNNPTGTSVGAEAMERFLQGLPADLVVVVDEVYAEFARRPDFPDLRPWLARRPGTALLRSFSKLYGLAGLRVGYGVMDVEMAGYLERARHPFNLNLLGERAAIAALEDEAHVARTLKLAREGAAFLSEELGALGVRVWPTDTNFLLAEAGPDAYEVLLREGVIVRPMAGFGLPDHVRITIGTRKENERIVRTLAALRGRAGGAS